MFIRKTWPTSRSGVVSTASRTQPVPSMAWCVRGSASAANTSSGVAEIVRLTATFWFVMVLALSGRVPRIGVRTQRWTRTGARAHR